MTTHPDRHAAAQAAPRTTRARSITTTATALSLLLALGRSSPACAGELALDRAGLAGTWLPRPGKYTRLGGTIGALAGGLLGLGLAEHFAGARDGHESTPQLAFAIVFGCAWAGGITGYAVAGGFSDERADAALERDRDALRRARASEVSLAEEAVRTEATIPLPELRLSVVAGVDFAPPVLMADAR